MTETERKSAAYDMLAEMIAELLIADLEIYGDGYGVLAQRYDDKEPTFFSADEGPMYVAIEKAYQWWKGTVTA